MVRFTPQLRWYVGYDSTVKNGWNETTHHYIGPSPLDRNI
jgi:hypothetical protein